MCDGCEAGGLASMASVKTDGGRGAQYDLSADRLSWITTRSKIAPSRHACTTNGIPARFAAVFRDRERHAWSSAPGAHASRGRHRCVH